MNVCTKLVSVITVIAVLSGCATLAQPVIDEPVSRTTDERVFNRLPADYELPPYIRIASLPVIHAVSDLPAQNLSVLGDYWLFSTSGYTLDVGAWSSVDAARAALAHQTLDIDEIRLIQLGVSDALTVRAFFGAYATHNAAISAQQSFGLDHAQITSIRTLKAKRCEVRHTPDIDALCNGAPVKTLRIATVIE